MGCSDSNLRLSNAEQISPLCVFMPVGLEADVQATLHCISDSDRRLSSLY
jgi:hypothetical protein